MSGVAVGADLAAREKHEKGATYTAAGLAAAQGALAVAGPLFKAAGAADTDLFRGALDGHDLPGLKALADGADVRVSAMALLKSGIKQMPDLADLADAYDEVRPAMNEADGITLPGAGQVRNALNAVSNTLIGKGNEFLHLGADTELSHSPAAIMYQHLDFLTTRADHGLDVIRDQVESNSQSSSQSQGPPA